MTIQMKAIEQYLQVMLFDFYNFAKMKFQIFPSVLNLALLGVKGLRSLLFHCIRSSVHVYLFISIVVTFYMGWVLKIKIK